MVNDRVVSRFAGKPTRENGGIIQWEPLYPAQEVLDVLAQRGAEAFTLWTRDCVKDVQNLALDHEGVGGLITQAVTDGRFLNAQWCQQKPGGPWAALRCLYFCSVRVDRGSFQIDGYSVLRQVRLEQEWQALVACILPYQ